MPRRAPKPWYRTSHRMWFCTISGVQHPLHVSDPTDRPAAERAQQQLVEQLATAVAARLQPPPAPIVNASCTVVDNRGQTVADAVAAFLTHGERKVAAGKIQADTLKGYRATLTDFSGAFGPRPLPSLTAEEVEGWADRPAWSSSTQNGQLGTVGAFLRWCKVPLALTRPPKESRGADAVLTDEQFEAVIANVVRGNFAGDIRELLRMLRETGCRPGEAANLTADQVDWGNAVAVLKHHKTKRKTGRDRIIHLNAAALAVLTAQRTRYGAGLLFRTRAGRVYRPTAIVQRMITASERCGFHATAYGLGRHSYASQALVNGVPDAMVAHLLGHIGTGMLTKHYAHLGQHAAALKAAAEQATRRTAG